MLPDAPARRFGLQQRAKRRHLHLSRRHLHFHLSRTRCLPPLWWQHVRLRPQLTSKADRRVSGDADTVQLYLQETLTFLCYTAEASVALSA